MKNVFLQVNKILFRNTPVRMMIPMSNVSQILQRIDGSKGLHIILKDSTELMLPYGTLEQVTEKLTAPSTSPNTVIILE